jgi:hypothetical protein
MTAGTLAIKSETKGTELLRNVPELESRQPPTSPHPDGNGQFHRSIPDQRRQCGHRVAMFDAPPMHMIRPPGSA